MRAVQTQSGELCGHEALVIVWGGIHERIKGTRAV